MKVLARFSLFAYRYDSEERTPFTVVIIYPSNADICSTFMNSLRIIFMGTPEFAVPSLDILVEHKLNVVAQTLWTKN